MRARACLAASQSASNAKNKCAPQKTGPDAGELFETGLERLEIELHLRPPFGRDLGVGVGTGRTNNRECARHNRALPKHRAKHHMRQAPSAKHRTFLARQ